jgi:hypothetical protein
MDDRSEEMNTPSLRGSRLTSKPPPPRPPGGLNTEGIVNRPRARKLAARDAKRTRDAGRPPVIVKDGSLKPFKHARAVFMAIMKTRVELQNNLFALSEALTAFPPYTSRGHGWKGRIKNRQITGNWNQSRSKYEPHQGKKELAKAAYHALPAHMRDEVNRISAQIMEEGI